MPLQLILFDLDGTLLNTLQDIADSANAALMTTGFPPRPVDAYRYFVGEGMRMLAVKALPENARDSETIDKVLQLIDSEYAKRWMRHTCIYDGLPELLDTLTAKNIKMAVFSNKPQVYTIASVERFLAKWSFEAILGASEEIARKPDPSGALLIALNLKIPVENFIYLGDTATDMKTAAAAGMYPVGALWGFRPAEELMAGGAQKLVSKPSEILQFFINR